MTSSLGDKLSLALTNLTSLIMATDSIVERKQLTTQHAEVAGQLQVFVDGVVVKTLPEYKAATDALDVANAKAKAAKEQLDSISGAIIKFAVAIDKLASLATKVAAA